MIVLGVDPGYRNLGLCLLKVSEDGKAAKIIWSESSAVGKATAPLMFVRFLWPKLERLHREYGPIQGIASETPPFIMGQIRTTAFLWAVSTIIVSWAHHHSIPFRHAAPLSLKRAVCRALGKEFDRKAIPKKSEVKETVIALVGEGCKTSHENDAALAGLLMFSNMVPEK
jgi:Holliday junction resolvasome RuvABC endonuclease subunit